MFKEIADKTGVPGLQDGIKALVIILDAMQKTSQNADDVESFVKRIEGLTEMLKKATQGNGQLSKEMLDRIDRLFKTWDKSAKEVQKIGSQNYAKRLINHDNDERAIAAQITTITWSIHTFTVESMLAIEFALDDTHSLVKQSAGRIEGKLNNIHQGIQEIKMRQDIYGGLVQHTIAVWYDCNDKLISWA